MTVTAVTGTVAVTALTGAETAQVSAQEEDHPRVSLNDWLPDVAATKGIGPPVVASGVVRDEQGQPMSGAAVHLELWPSVPALERMDDDAIFETTPAAKTVADSQGHYELRLDPSAVRGIAGQLVDVTVGAWTEEHGAVTSESTVYFERQGQLPPQAASAITQVDAGSGSARRPMEVNLMLGRLANRGEPAADVALEAAAEDSETPADAADDVALMGHSCPYSVKGLGKKWVHVGAVHIPANGVNGRFNYLSEAASTLGVGVSGSGTYGSFSSSGTVTRDRQTETGFPKTWATQSKYWDTTFRYSKYCTAWHSPGPEIKYTVKAVNQAGGTRGRDAGVPRTPGTYCSRYEPGSYEVFNKTNAITWSNGAKLGSTIGIDLSSRTGFRTNAKLRFNFVGVNRKFLCGTHGDVADAPRNVVARNKKPA